MASPGLQIFREACCLIYTDDDNRPAVNEDVAAELQQIRKPCVVVSIAGLYRTGKSYLMNRLAGHTSSFHLGSTVQSKTKGIWVWVRMHPAKKFQDHCLVLLDTEGLGDAEKGDINHDSWIFCLAALLGSTLVYNALGVIDENMLEQLNFICEMLRQVKLKQSLDDGFNDVAHVETYFPQFVFALRDFTLELVLDGRDITSDEYLEHVLQLKQDSDDATDEEKTHIHRYNMPRKCIRQYFKDRKCFTFDRPTSRKKLPFVDQMSRAQLSKDFVDEMDLFCEYIYENTPAKTIEDNQPIDGTMLASLVKTYVEAIREGNMPCIESATVTLAKLHNTRTVNECVEFYRGLISHNVSLPVMDEENLTSAHRESVKKALEYFAQRCYLDDGGDYHKQATILLQDELTSLVKKNTDASLTISRAVLTKLARSITKKIKHAVYCKVGGYEEYQEDLQKVIEDFQQTTGLGNKKDDVLKEFLDAKTIESETIIAMDKILTAKEDVTAAEEKAAFQCQQEQEDAQRVVELNRARFVQSERDLQDTIEKLKDKHKQNLKVLKVQCDDILHHELAKQKDIILENHNQLAQSLRNEIASLK